MKLKVTKTHTPGPWKVSTEERVHHHVCFDHGAGLCEVASVSPVETGDGRVMISAEQAEANARLIAAAPELLRAAKLALATIEAQVGITVAGIDDDLRRAIAKAEGRE